HKVILWGRKSSLTREDLARQCQVIILSMPLEASVEEAGRIGPMLAPDQALMDLCSLKVPIALAMEKGTAAQVVATHPLFGPDALSLKGQNVIVCPMRGRSWCNWLTRLLESQGALVTLCTPAFHDQNMAIVQGLTHFVTIVLGQTLKDMNLSPDDLLPFATPIFRLKLNLVGRLLAQDPELFTKLISANPTVVEVLQRFLATAKNTGEIFCGDKPQQGVALLDALAQNLGDFPAQAKQESDACLAVVSQQAKKSRGA
ncbi:MAG: prephenate dehydrogenase/arogenate dehydrogenase family protein, partial [Desulfatibacillaceae bacterium]|nr:prephenate dehydrogenase/arogenate dehydrogenase family protein [Desulfatibacillaceae bacterium]